MSLLSVRPGPCLLYIRLCWVWPWDSLDDRPEPLRVSLRDHIAVRFTQTADSVADGLEVAIVAIAINGFRARRASVECVPRLKGMQFMEVPVAGVERTWNAQASGSRVSPLSRLPQREVRCFWGLNLFHLASLNLSPGTLPADVLAVDGVAGIVTLATRAEVAAGA